jgi:hypothetical protein
MNALLNILGKHLSGTYFKTTKIVGTPQTLLVGI